MNMTSCISALILATTLPLLAAPSHAGLLEGARSALNTASAPAVATTPPVSGDLVSMVSNGLGINNQQATGGLGALFSAAKGQLSGEDFGQIANAVPNMDQLLGAAPEAQWHSASGGPLPQGSSLGKALGGAGYLNGAFKKLGLSSDQIAPMANIAVQYLEGSSPEAAALLKQVTGTLM